MKSKLYVDVNQTIRYSIVGLSSSIVEYVTYSVVFYFTNIFYVANVAAFLLNVLNTFYWDRRFVFRDSRKIPWWKVLLKTYMVFFGTGVIGVNLLSYIFIRKCGISPYVSPIINILILSPINYFLVKYWACYFDKSNKEEE